MASQAKISPMKDNSQLPQQRRRSHNDVSSGATAVRNLFGGHQQSLNGGGGEYERGPASSDDISLESMEEGSISSHPDKSDILATMSTLKVMRKVSNHQAVTSCENSHYSEMNGSNRIDKNDISPIKGPGPLNTSSKRPPNTSERMATLLTDSGANSICEESKDYFRESDSTKYTGSTYTPSKDLLTRDEKEVIAQTFLKMADPKTEQLSTEGFCRYFTDGNMAKAQNMLVWFDADASGCVSLEEFMDGLEDLEGSDWRKQAEFEFLCMSSDQKTLSEYELYELYRQSLRDSSVPEATIVKLSKRLLYALQQTSGGERGRDPTPRSHRISIDQFLEAIEANSQLATFFKFSAMRFVQRAQGGLAASPQTSSKGKSVWPPQPSFNERAACGFIAAYILASLSLIIYTVVKYRSLGAAVQVQVARVGGSQLNLHTLLLLASMCQNTHLFIASRSMLLSQLMALDFSVQLHKIFGKMTIVWTTVHISGHIANYSINRGYSASYIGSKVLWFTNTGLTGTILTALLLLISAGYALRKRNTSPLLLSLRGFELFYLTHRLTPLYAAIMIAHAPSCRYWLAPPLALLMLEWAQRVISARVHSTYPMVVRIHASEVTELVLKRPEFMKSYLAGSYIQVCIPRLSGWEWHPFSLTSAPDRRDGTLSVHIKARGQGSWTDRLRSMVELRVRDNRREKLVVQACSRSYSQSSSGKDLDDQAHREYVRDIEDLTVYVKGPFFGPSMHIFSYEHVIFVAGGIGVTPFAGILEAIVMRCNNSNISDYGLNNVHALGRLKVVHFLWLLNDMESTSWFTSLLAAAGETRTKNEDLKKLFHFQIYLTSVASGMKEDALFIVSLAALCGIAEKDQREVSNPLLKGLKERTHVGRPKWDSVLGKIKNGSPHQDSIGLFYCGPPGISGDIAAACAGLNMDFRSEYFD